MYYNASAVKLAQAPGVRSYLALAEKLGAILAQMTPVQASAITEKQWKTMSRMSGFFLDVLQGLPTLKR